MQRRRSTIQAKSRENTTNEDHPPQCKSLVCHPHRVSRRHRIRVRGRDGFRRWQDRRQGHVSRCRADEEDHSEQGQGGLRGCAGGSGDAGGGGQGGAGRGGVSEGGAEGQGVGEGGQASADQQQELQVRTDGSGHSRRADRHPEFGSCPAQHPRFLRQAHRVQPGVAERGRQDHQEFGQAGAGAHRMRLPRLDAGLGVCGRQPVLRGDRRRTAASA